MNRTEHLEWAKNRAKDENTAPNMWASFTSDMSKHEELQTHVALQLGTMFLMTNPTMPNHEMEKFIDGFN